MDFNAAIELLTDGCRLAEAYTVTTPEEDDVIAVGLRLVNRQLLRSGRVQTGGLSDQDRAAITVAAKTIMEALGALDYERNPALGGEHHGHEPQTAATS